MTRLLLILLFAGILAAMVALTIYASLDCNLLNLDPKLTSDPWFHATLADAYVGFLTFYVWVAYRESSTWRRAVWFALIMTLDNIAMAVYMLIRLWHWDPEQGVAALLLRECEARSATET